MHWIKRTMQRCRLNSTTITTLASSKRSLPPPPTHLAIHRPSFQMDCRRLITTGDAKQLLGFSKTEQPTVAKLRGAYFHAAKQCHPDLQQHADDDETVMDFKEITEAYELLLSSDQVQKDADGNLGISVEEEERYRGACMQILGIPAEIVEESKRNPMFRHWLGGNTDGAQYWRAFFSVHGGLAQKLRPPAGFLESNQKIPKSQSRRKRRK